LHAAQAQGAQIATGTEKGLQRLFATVEQHSHPEPETSAQDDACNAYSPHTSVSVYRCDSQHEPSHSRQSEKHLPETGLQLGVHQPNSSRIRLLGREFGHALSTLDCTSHH
jgi:hypothetical protein